MFGFSKIVGNHHQTNSEGKALQNTKSLESGLESAERDFEGQLKRIQQEYLVSVQSQLNEIRSLLGAAKVGTPPLRSNPSTEVQ